jgi:hypothetical protein
MTDHHLFHLHQDNRPGLYGQHVLLVRSKSGFEKVD